jgi:hypothetical protein
LPNHWVEKDAGDRASHPKRYVVCELSVKAKSHWSTVGTRPPAYYL